MELSSKKSLETILYLRRGFEKTAVSLFTIATLQVPAKQQCLLNTDVSRLVLNCFCFGGQSKKTLEFLEKPFMSR